MATESLALKESKAKRAKSARLFASLTRAKIQEKYGIHSSTLRAWEACGLTKKGAKRLVNVLKNEGVFCTVEWLLSGIGVGPRLLDIPVLANQQEDNTVTNWTEEETIFKEIQFFKKVNPNPIILIVMDDGMEPLFSIGEYVAGNVCDHKKIDQYVGRNCIIELENGQVLCRKLMRGSAKDKYNICCINLDSLSISDIILHDVKILSLAEIIWYRKKELQK